jgi:hypothetical protein
MEYVDLVNQALQKLGTRTTVNQSDLDNDFSNEAIQANLIITEIRDKLLRMAPWNCARSFLNMALISAAPGTPENTSPATALWQPGQPAPPWIYEYQYPVDCMRPCFIVPAFQTGFGGGIPITTAVTGGAAAFWQGPPVKYNVAVDQFYPATSVTVVDGGTGYAINDFIRLESGPTDEAPIGAPADMLISNVGPGGVIIAAVLTSQVRGQSAPPYAGSYFAKQTADQGVGLTDGAGTGATFSLTWGNFRVDQRVILTNQESAVLSYIKQVTNVNVWDDLFRDAYVSLLAAGLAMALTGDKALANSLVEVANQDIVEARKADGNEGLTINDVTPDFIRFRGIDFPGGNMWTGNQGFDWGPLWSAW